MDEDVDTLLIIVLLLVVDACAVNGLLTVEEDGKVDAVEDVPAVLVVELIVDVDGWIGEVEDKTSEDPGFIVVEVWRVVTELGNVNSNEGTCCCCCWNILGT